MLARLQQCITVGLLMAALAWFIAFYRFGHPVVGCLGAMLILLGYAAFLAAEFVILAVVGDLPEAPVPTATQLVRAWWGEVRTAPLVFCWRQPFRSKAEPDRPEGARGAPGVLLVHGFVCNRGFWNPWLARLRTDGVPFVAINLEPLFGSISAYADSIDAAVSKLMIATGAPPIVVAHSMGGLAVREWLRKHVAYHRVAHVVTIGTPHRGTWLARWGRTANGLEMRMKSDWLSALAADRPGDVQTRFTCFYGNCDNIVFPASTARLPRADNRLVTGVAHVRLAFDPRVIEPVFQLIASTRRVTTREPEAASGRHDEAYRRSGAEDSSAASAG